MIVGIRMLGGFGVTVDDVPVPADAWARRHAAWLVQLLALSSDRRLHREQVVDALWPGLSLEAAGPRLHKAAHYARRALGGSDAVVLRNDVVALWPGASVQLDVESFQQAARDALASGTTDAAEHALAQHAGPLLPDEVYQPWTDRPRDAVRTLHLDLLRQAGRWEQLLAEEPADEAAHLALARACVDRGDLPAALRQLERADQALRRELGTAPSPEAAQLRAMLEQRVAKPAARPQGTRLFGRRDVGDRVRDAMDRAAAGHGGTLLFTGPPGVGKSAVLDLAVVLAGRRGWRTGRGTAAAVEGPWPYSPVLEALGDLCRAHPSLLDGLDDAFRDEIERALSGRDVAWTGESGHQRLFVAVAELVRLAAAGRGLMLVVDDLHEADDASLRLLHYLSRCALTEPVLLVLAHREPAPVAVEQIAASLVARGTGARVPLAPLDKAVTLRLLADRFASLDTKTAEAIWSASGGLPFTVLELAARAGSSTGGLLPVLPAPVLRTFQRVALLGTVFTTDELLAVSGVGEEEGYRHLESALAALLVEPCGGGYCFRHALVREALVEQMSPVLLATARRDVAARLSGLGAPPGRVAHQYIAAGLPSRAVPYVIRAVESAGALGAYRDALGLVEAVRPHADQTDLPRLLARRGDLLMALGDPSAIAAYREAVGVTTGTEHRLVRARLARAAWFEGDLDTARAALAGLRFEGDAADAPILLAQAHAAYFAGDVATAWDITDRARDRLQSPDDPWYLVDLVTLQGLIAHERGDWFERFRMELRRTQGKQQMVTALFDAHLCVAEYLLYGRVPYDEVIKDAEELRTRATQAGALRGVAFATALIGEAALHSGDLERAEHELVGAVDLHREIDAAAGEAHSLERLAALRLLLGDQAEAQRLLQRALPLARWSVISKHLLHRVYGTMIGAASDPAAARAVVDQAEATLGEPDRCPTCAVMLAVPAAIACADVGDVDLARDHLRVAEASVARRWDGSAWEAALLEARAHLARAEGREEDVPALVAGSTRLFTAVGHAGDAVRSAAFGVMAPARV